MKISEQLLRNVSAIRTKEFFYASQFHFQFMLISYTYPFIHVVACPRELEALGTDLYIEWPQTVPGVQVTVQCPCGIPTSDMYATRKCSGDAQSGVNWEESNTANCSYDPRTLALCSMSTMVRLHKNLYTTGNYMYIFGACL